MSNTPKQLFRYPAEWEPQATTWLTWPKNQNEWGDRLNDIRSFYRQLIQTILPYQSVSLIINQEHRAALLDQGVFDGFKHSCHFYDFENDDVWIRDYGPLFVEDAAKKPCLLNFEFNSYGGKFPPWDKDNQIPQQFAQHFHFNCQNIPFILEGGSIELNGENLLITTEQCLLDQQRNPHLNKSDYESQFRSLGIDHCLWLKNGLRNDHTDGHIDNFVRFIDPSNIIVCQTSDHLNGQYEVLSDAYQRLKNWVNTLKRPLHIHTIPMPDHIEFEGEVLPASYANFIFVNGAFIVPTYDHPNDQEALEILQNLLPKLDIIGIDCNLLIQEGGGLHCISKQQPLFSNS